MAARPLCEVAQSEGHKRLWLYTNKLMAENIAFYQRLGYPIDREERNTGLGSGRLHEHPFETAGGQMRICLRRREFIAGRGGVAAGGARAAARAEAAQKLAAIPAAAGSARSPGTGCARGEECHSPELATTRQREPWRRRGRSGPRAMPRKLVIPPELSSDLAVVHQAP